MNTMTANPQLQWSFIVTIILPFCFIFANSMPTHSIHANNSLGIYGNDVLLRANGSGRGIWIDMFTSLPQDYRLQEFYIYIHESGGSAGGSMSFNLFLQIWRPTLVDDVFTLVWEKPIQVPYPANDGLLYKVRVGNTNSGEDFYTQQDDRIGFTGINQDTLVSYDDESSMHNHSWFFNFDPSNTGSKPVLNENFTFQQVTNKFSVAVQVLLNPKPFVNTTITTDGCTCQSTNSNDCACCESIHDCHCPGVTWPAQCTNCNNIDTCPSDFICDLLTTDGCFVEEYADLNFTEASDLCYGKTDTYFSNIYINTIHEVAMVAAENNWPVVWTGAYVNSYSWSWILSDKIYLQEVQGCFDQASGSYAILSQNKGSVSTDQDCINICDEDNYIYASVGQNSDATLQCFCGNKFDFQREINLTYCRCASDNTQWCGGTTYQTLFNVNGKRYTNFVGDVMPGHNCAAIDTSVSGWVKTGCLEFDGYGHVCEYPGTNSQCSNTNQLLLNNRCFSLHTENYNWYESVNHCAYLYGHLAKIDNKQLDEALINRLSQTQTKWWIGLTNRAFIWSDVSNTIPVTDIFSYWAPGQPDLTHDCVVLNEMDGYNWTTYACDQPAFFYCIKDHNNCAPNTCQNGGTCMDTLNDYMCDCIDGWGGKDCSQAKISASSTSPTSLVTGTTPNVGGSGGGNGGGGGSGALTTAAIIGVVIAAVLVFILAAIVITALCYRSKKMEKELMELKSAQQNGTNSVNTTGDFQLTRQDTVYEQIDDTYESPGNQSTDASNSHYYKGLGNYQGLEGRTGEPTQYQDLSNGGTTYQGLQGDGIPATSPQYQHLNSNDPAYHGLDGQRDPDVNNEYADLKNSSNANKAPDVPSRPVSNTHGLTNNNNPIPVLSDGIYLHVIGPESDINVHL